MGTFSFKPNESLDEAIARHEANPIFPPLVLEGREGEMVMVCVRVKSNFYADLFYRCGRFWKKEWRAVYMQRGLVDRLNKETGILEVKP